MSHLILYTTLGCHLCEQLEALLARLHRGVYRLERVEISEDEALMTRYGVRIPVLVDERGEELDRGFEPPRLAAWLAARDRLDEAAWAGLEGAGVDSAEEGERKAWRGAVMRQGRRYLG